MSRRGYKGRDAWSAKAQREGYEARSIYKLEELDRRFGLLRRGQRVVDLGCFPGSWSRYAFEQVGSSGVLVGVDLQEPALTGPIWVVRSVYDVAAAEITEALGGPADVLLSDMAPRTTGDRFGDHVRQVELAQRALALAKEVVAPGGAFVAKVFDGEDAPGFVDDVRAAFARVKRVRPKAVRKPSREFFVVGRDKRPSDVEGSDLGG